MRSKNTPLKRTKTTSVLSDDNDDHDYAADDDETNIVIIIIIIIIMSDQPTWKARFNEVQNGARLAMHT